MKNVNLLTKTMMNGVRGEEKAPKAQGCGAITPDNGPTMDREWSDNGPTMVRVLSRIVPITARQWLDNTPTTSRVWRYVAMLLMVLTLGAGEMWGADASSATITYDNTKSNWSDVQLMIGHSSYSSVYNMTRITNTNLYYLTSFSWGGYSEFYFVSGASSWGNEGNSPTHRKDYVSGYSAKQTTNVGSSKYTFISSGTSNGASLTNKTTTSYSGLNYTQTLNQTLSTDGGSSYSASTAAIATVKVSSYKLTSYTASAASSGTIASGSSSTSCTAAQSAVVTYSVSSVATGYEFVGWYDGSTQKSTSTSYTYNATEAKTITARFKETQYSLTFSHNGHGTIAVGGATVSSGSTANVNHITTKTLVATPSTGYNFSGWTKSGSNTSSVTIGNASNASTTIKATNTGATITAGFTAKTYAITLDGNGGSDGSATATYNSSSLSSVSGSSRPSYDLNGYFTATSGGTKVINANGTLVASAGSYTNSSSEWIYDDDVELHAQWTYNPVTYSVTYAVGTSYTSYGSVSAVNTSTSSAISSGSSVESGTGVTFTATPNAHYKVAGWYSNASCTSAIAGAGTSTTYATTISANTTVYVKFVIMQTEITLDLHEGSGSTSVTATHGSALPSFIVATRTGHTLNGYYTAESSGTKIINADKSLPASVSGYTTSDKKWDHTGSALTLHAQWTEKMSTLSTSNHYDAGNPSYAAPTVSGSATTVGYSTTRSITATSAGTGYTFTGWTLTNCTRTDGGAETATTITIRSNGDAAAASVVANYEEDLSSRWHLVGENVTSKVTFPDGWNVNSTSMMQKETGHSTESAVYGSAIVSDPSGTYEFKVVDDNGASSDIWYGYSTGGTFLTWTATDTKNVYSGNDNANNLKFTPTIAGTYLFKVDYSGTYPAVTITYPTPYTVTYSVSPAGAGGAITTSPSVSSGGEIASGTSVTFTHGDANTGYEWYRWEDGSGSSLGTGSTYTTSITANTTVVAKYSAKTYTISLDQQTSADGYGSSGTASVPTVTYNAVLPTISGSMPTTTGYYGFMGFYTAENGTGDRLTDASGVWIASVDGYTDADKKWIHDGNITLYAYYKTAEITELTFVNAVVSPSATVQVTPTIVPTPVVSTHIDWRVLYSNGTALPSQPAMSEYNTNGVQFTAPASSATFKVEAVLRTGTTPGAGTTIHTKTADFQVAGDHTVTVQYKCGDMTIKASTTLEEIHPLEWSDDITAPSITGYTFSGWIAGDGVTIKDGESSTTTTHIKASYDGTLTANYTKKRLIYFYNTLNWENVYVYFYKNSSYWEGSGESRGTGADQSYTWTNTPYSEGKHGQMQPIEEGSNIYYFDAEGAGVNASYTTVTFTKDDQHGYGYFWQTEAVKRDDYNSTTLPMFVPLANQTPAKHNQTNYYFNGYWMNYPENTGYSLMIYESKDGGAAVRDSIPFAYTADLMMPMTLTVELDAGRTYGFEIYRNDRTYLGNTGTMKVGNSVDVGETSWKFNENVGRCGLQTSVAGEYTITMNYSNSGGYGYLVGVHYPISANDYRIVYNDRVAWSHESAHDASWQIVSRSIHKEDGAKDTVSFYVSKATGASATMKFQYASAVSSEGVVTWTDVASGSIDLSSISKTGVYNFCLTQSEEAISVEAINPYTGNYYIRTDCAGNTKWANYRALDHQMTYSDYAEKYSDYSHYYVHWVTSDKNIKFCIANDYSMCISDTLNGDSYTYNNTGWLADGANANIRFMWKQSTNTLSRAYISGSGNITDRFLVLEGDDKMFDENGHALTGDYQDHDQYGTKLGTDNQVIMHDDENFVYERTIQVKPGAQGKLTAKYNNNVQYFIGSSTETVELLGGESESKYTMRIIYDFKTNRLVTAYIPSGTITEPLAIHADIMLVREHQEAGQQLTFSGEGAALSDVKTVYGVMRFNRWTLNNKSTAEGHSPVGDPKSAYERSLYWISFPFDVNLSDVFGFGTYGTDWIIMEYDGAERAAEGYWADSEGFWKYIFDRRGVVLEAGKGYVLALDLDRMKDNNTSFWTNNIEQVELFFPSASEIENIEKTNTEITVDSHECTITARPGMSDDRTKKDSHWNIIGVPSYANYGSELKDGNNTTITWNENPSTQDLPFLYEWNMVDNTYSVQSGTTYPFKSMHAYMVQYYGTIKWLLASATPSSAPARVTNAPQNIEFRLELQENDKMTDQTFIRMTNDEAISANFDFNYDLSKQMNSGKANIYTMVEGYIQTAGNCLPMSEQTTVVPVGVKTAANGDYTFSMPEGTEGIGVVLIDTETGIRTSLSALDYTVSLDKGTYDERFILEISPIYPTPTAVETVSDEQSAVSGVRKMLIDGLLYIVREGKMFDARGARVE